MSKKRIAALAVGGLLVLGAIGSALEDESTTTASPNTSAPETSLSGSGGSSSVSGDFQQWANEMVAWSTEMSNTLSSLGTALQDEAFLVRLANGSDSAAAELEPDLSALADCTDSLPAAPDEPRAEQVERNLLRACAHYESSVRNFRSGLDSSPVDVTAITLAGTELTLGNEALNEATAALGG